MKLSRSKRIVQTGLPDAFSQKAPVPGHPTVRSAPDSNSPSIIFMPRIWAVVGARRGARRPLLL
jgi:hypothetical protein